MAKIWGGVKTLMQKGLVLKGSALKGVMPKALNLKGLMLRVSKALGFKGVMLKGRMSKTSGINGMMPKGLPLRGMVAAVVMAAGCGEAYGLKGAWRGELDLGRTKLPLVLRFSESEAGETRCTLDSPSQGARGIEMAVELCTADSVALSCEALRARFTGRVMGCLIRGRFEQQGAKLPLNLVPEIVIGERRPQTPKPPYPFSVVDTVFTAADGAVMSATLCMPAEAEGTAVPAVVMVTGSGPQNRDEELMDHRPFAVIADYLARRGIASLRYDDRGTGRSTGDFASATTYTFKDDAVSGWRLLIENDIDVTLIEKAVEACGTPVIWNEFGDLSIPNTVNDETSSEKPDFEIMALITSQALYKYLANPETVVCPMIQFCQSVISQDLKYECYDTPWQGIDCPITPISKLIGLG